MLRVLWAVTMRGSLDGTWMEAAQDVDIDGWDVYDVDKGM